MKTVKVEKMSKAERIQCEEIIARYARNAVGGTLQTKDGADVGKSFQGFHEKNSCRKHGG